MRLIFILCIFILMGCNPKEYRANWLSSKLETKFDFKSRTPAKVSGCYVDKWNQSKIASDIGELEKIYENWSSNREFPLSGLNQAQNFYLSEYSDLLGDVKIHKDDCQDFYCNLNFKYKNISVNAGSNLYHWYLKTGIIADSENALFEEDEIFALTQLAGALPDIFWQGNIYSIEKVNSSSHGNLRNRIQVKSGSILIQNKLFSGPFYEGLVHEFGHALDQWASVNSYNPSFSLLPKWYEKNWIMNEGISRGVVKSDFVYDNTKSKNQLIERFEHPSEEFVHYLQESFFNPDKLKKENPQIFDFLTNHIFNGQGFDFHSLKKRYEGIIDAKVNANMGELVRSCLIIGEKFNNECIDEKVKNLVGSVIANLREEEYFACSFWDNRSELVSKIIKDSTIKVKDNITKYSLDPYTIDEFNSQIVELKNQIGVSCDERAILFETFNNEKPQQAFEKSLHTCLMRFNSKRFFPLVKEQILSANPYKDVLFKTGNEIDRVFKTSRPKLRELANNLIKVCKNDESTKLILNPFNAGNIYLKSGVLSCINSKIMGQLDSLIHERLKTKYNFAKSGIRFIESRLIPIFLNEIQNVVVKFNKEEILALEKLDLKNNLELEKKIYNKNASFLDEDSTQFYRQCHNRIAKDIVSYTKEKLEKQRDIITIAYHEVASEVGQEFCFRIKTKKLTQKGIELATIEDTVKDFVDNYEFKDKYAWFKTIKNTDSWSNSCRDFISLDASIGLSKIYNKKLHYYTKKMIVELGLNKLCENMYKRFDLVMQDYTKDLRALDLARTYQKIISGNLYWLNESSEHQMIKKCENTYRSLLVGENHKVEQEYLSDSVKNMLVASQICHRGKMVWRDLMHELEDMDPYCVDNCWNDVHRRVKEYFISMDNTVWNYLNQKLDDKLIKKVLAKFDEEIDKQVQRCHSNSFSEDLAKVKLCLESEVFTSQNLALLVRKIYPEKKRMIAEHLQKINSHFESSSQKALQLVANFN